MSDTIIFGRRYPRFVESVNGTITDVITPGFVQITQPPAPREESTVLCQNRFPFPYSVIFVDGQQPQIVAVRYKPKSKILITPYSELVLE